MNHGLKLLVGSGDKIGLFVLPFLIVGLTLNIIYPSFFSVGGPPMTLKIISVIILIFGLIVWGSSAFLILKEVPKHKLITRWPYSVVKHPLYTGVALLVLPFAGFLLNSWLGVIIGLALYIGSRIYSVDEEKYLAQTFGSSWKEYANSVKIPWL